MTTGLNTAPLFNELFQIIKISPSGIGGELILSKQLKRAEMEPEKALLSVKIKKKKSWDDRGVAATVGTILSLMVFLTGIGMFTNQYVPIWMEDNESSHMNTVIAQFSMLKAGVDMQILTSSSSDEVSSAPIYTPMKLHADGIPVFASPTAGSLGITAESMFGYPSFTIRFNYTAGSGASAENFELNASNGGKAGGGLEFKGMNRYFVQQTVSYENGAIILNQTDGEIVLSGIAIRIASYGGDAMIKMTQIALSGTNKSLGGFGTKSVTSVLEFANYGKFNSPAGSTMTFTVVTKYGSAWENYFQELRDESDADIPMADWSITKSAFTVGVNTYYTVVVAIDNINSLEYTRAVVSMSMADISV